jgi:hypothetical protein
MKETQYLFLLSQGNLTPLRETFRTLEGFWNGCGYAFPMQSESAVHRLIINLPNTRLHKLPLSEGQSFASYRQSHKAAFFQEKLIEIDKNLFVLKEQHRIVEDFTEEGISSSSGISEAAKEAILALLHERENLKKAVEWARGLEITLSNYFKPRFDLRSISEISPNYFMKKPPEKAKLLYFVENDGTKVAYLHKGIVGQIIAEGGRGKTHLLAMLGACVATGLPWMQKFLIETPGAVAILGGEDDDEDLHRLLWKTHMYLTGIVAEHAKAPENNKPFLLHFENPLEQLSKNLFPVSVRGIKAAFIDGKGIETVFYNDLLNQLKSKEPDAGWQLIIFDPASRFAGPEAEKDNAIATAFIATLESISRTLKGQPTIIFAHHKSKAAQQNSMGQSDARGSSGLTDGCRWQANLNRDGDSTNSSILQVTKTNFTLVPRAFKFKKQRDGVPCFSSWIDEEKFDHDNSTTIGKLDERKRKK